METDGIFENRLRISWTKSKETDTHQCTFVSFISIMSLVLNMWVKWAVHRFLVEVDDISYTKKWLMIFPIRRCERLKSMCHETQTTNQLKTEPTAFKESTNFARHNWFTRFLTSVSFPALHTTTSNHPLIPSIIHQLAPKMSNKLYADLIILHNK
jgi:hypothetical protein